MINYDENIGDIKQAFLTVYDEMETKNASAADALAYLIYRQIELREKKAIKIAVPKTTDIEEIVSLFARHFSFAYKGRGASRLPVLAFYAIYKVLVDEIGRFQGKKLAELREHAAADSQTGAIGDVEVLNPDETVFEALEIKHGIQIDETILQGVKGKLMDKSVDRFYILTTHPNCDPATFQTERANIRARLNCQVIINGVLPSIKYYLRLLRDPARIFPIYADLLQKDKSIGHEHRETWNLIVTG